ncbi:hypothetical protein EC514_07250, partial [Helicobacter pylori]|uniref:hypothetical protein n=1 Tax=Helicobacter pylori TaxID=210 RepID=UPI000FDE57B2
LGVCKSKGFVKIGGVFKAKTEQNYSKQYFLAKVFSIKLFSHEKCNVFNLSLQINCSKNTLLSIKQKSLNQAQA